MKNFASILCISFFFFSSAYSLQAEIFIVNSLIEFAKAHDDANTNDTIMWEAGTFKDIYMNISKSNLVISAATNGETVFTGASRVKITSDHISLIGFQFIGGNIGTNDVINTSGSYNIFTQLNIRSYISYKYLVIREQCQYVTVSYCNFENRLNLDDKNILSILVSEDNPGYHKIRYCSFKNFDGSGNDLGIEPIRIGLSTQAKRISRSVVEYCYFTQCNGDGEIISSKATQNVYRYNTFENNPKAELVLHHGSEAIVYGNFFIKNKGGVRVREGQNHYIFNNYFEGINERALYLQNESSDPLNGITVAYNTIVNCSEVILGGSGSNKPTNVTFANNIFTDPDDELFKDPTGSETWIGNIAFGDLGMSAPDKGMTINDPLLIANSAGFYGLSHESPCIDAALPGYMEMPQFQGIEDLDVAILFDLMGQQRPEEIVLKDLGCNEFPHEVPIGPKATEENTGPTYNSSIISNVKK